MSDHLPFLESLYLTKEESHQLTQIFSRLGLPLPKDNAYMSASQGALVFMNNPACVLRIERSRATENVNHPAILQPIVRIPLGRYQLDICPGGRPVHWESVSDELVYVLAKDGILFSDYGARNCILLPMTTTEYPNGIPVVCDPPAVTRTTPLPADVTEEEAYLLTDWPGAFAQKQLYDALRHAFQHAWPDISRQPEPHKIQAFWQLCAGYTCLPTPASGVAPPPLSAGWQNREDTRSRFYKEAYALQAGEAYTRQLEEANFPAEIMPAKTWRSIVSNTLKRVERGLTSALGL